MKRLRLLRTAALGLVLSLSSATLAQEPGRQGPGDTTIQSETKARLTLRSQISSKLSEADDVISATLVEPIHAEGRLVLPRGTEFVGRITRVKPAKRLQRSSHLLIEFERIVTPSGEVPISAQVTAIDDWDREESIKADSEGKLKGGHRAEKTIDNMRKGAGLGLSGSIVGIALGGAFGASGRQVLGIGGAGAGVGMIAGLVLTKGREISVGPGATLRIKFLKPVTLPFIRQPETSQRSDK